MHDDVLQMNLREVMREEGIGVEELAKRAGVGRTAIITLRNGGALISTVAIAKICVALNRTPGDLFSVESRSVWTAIRRAKEVTIHYGSRIFKDQATGTGLRGPQYLGAWDLRAATRIYDALKKQDPEIQVQFREHVHDLSGRALRDSVDRILETPGNHVLIGSPLSLSWGEEVVCQIYGVPPFTRDQRYQMPFGFSWKLNHALPPSALGWPGSGKEIGIYSHKLNRIVAPYRDPSGSQPGLDCGLIMTHRIFWPKAIRSTDNVSESVIIGCFGYTGVSTLAAALVAINARFANDIYPPDPELSHLRTVTRHPRWRILKAPFTQPDPDAPHDNRELGIIELLPEEEELAGMFNREAADRSRGARRKVAARSSSVGEPASSPSKGKNR